MNIIIMPPTIGESDRHDRTRRRRRILPSVPIIASLAVALGDSRLAIALTNPAPWGGFVPSANYGSGARRGSMRVVGIGVIPTHARSSGAGGPISPSRGPTTTTTTRGGCIGATALRARSAQGDEQDFQRSLLEAKIANDIKNTIIKDERHRNEAVAKQIGQEKEELQDAVNEVKEAVQEISQSAKSLGGAVIGTASKSEAAREVTKSAMNLGEAFVSSLPRIFARLVTLCAASETR